MIIDRQRSVLLVVPAFNEAPNLPRLLRQIREDCPEWDVLVVDDGSTDGTAGVARACGAAVLSLPFNLGIGGAVQTGLMYALRRGYQVAAQIDADGQHAAADTARLVRALLASDADAVVGSRFLDREGFQSTPLRRVGIKVLRGIIRRFTGQVLTDPTSGQRVFGRRAIELLAADYPQEYPEPEAVYCLARRGLRVMEAPVSMQVRSAGRSSIRLLDSPLYMVKVILAILVRQTRRCPKESRHDSLVASDPGGRRLDSLPALDPERAAQHANER